MKHRALVLCVAAAFLFIMGCDPEEILVWSPDGSAAAVIGADGLRLSDPQGKLSRLLIPNATKAIWAGDSKNLIVAVKQEEVTWDQAAEVFGEQRQKAIVALADEMLREAKTFKGSWDEYLAHIVRLHLDESMDNFIGAILFLRSAHHEEMSQRFGKDWQKDNTHNVPLQRLLRYSASMNDATQGKRIGFGMGVVFEMRLSPDGRHLASVISHPLAQTSELYVTPTDGSSPPVRVANLVSHYVDWTADGSSLVYLKADSYDAAWSKQPQLGSLRRQKLTDDAGKWPAVLPNDIERPKPSEEAKGGAESLAAVVFDPSARVRCLKDGRILFSAFAHELPARPDAEPEKNLYVWSMGDKGAIRPLLAPNRREEISGDVNFFSVSPDEKRAAVSGPGGQVVLISLEDGSTSEIARARGEKEQRMVPAWRTSDQLFFARPADPNTAPQIETWSAADGTRTFSEQWPDEILGRLQANQQQGGK